MSDGEDTKFAPGTLRLVRIERRDRQPDGTQFILRNFSAGDRLPGSRVDRHQAARGKIAGALGRGWHIGDQGLAGRHPRAFVIGEEEHSVPDEWSAQCAAELAAPVLWRGLIGRREEIDSIERAVAKEFVSRAVELIAAGARDHADLSARVSAEGCVVCGSRDFELADRVHGRGHTDAVQLGIAIVGSVQQEVVGVFAAPFTLIEKAPRTDPAEPCAGGTTPGSSRLSS